MSLFAELRRRNVVRVGIAYAVIGWFLAQLAEFAFENFGAPDWVLKTFVVVLLLGLPLWAFEITPEGVKREKDVDRSTSITHSTGRKLDFVIIGALVLALGYFIFERQANINQIEPAEQANLASAEDVSDRSPDKRSIAVLPFVNMSSDQEQEWFADGLTEELLNALARAPDLLVAARTSSFKFKGSEEDIPTIAKALGVAHVLEGSVRRGRDRLRVTAQLIRASDGFHLWSETYDRNPDDVIAIQEDVAIAIARALKTAMDPEALAQMVSAGSTSVPAYEDYLEGLAFGARYSISADEQLILRKKAALERALTKDPEFAAAYFEMAKFWLSQLEVSSLGSDLTSDTPEARRTGFKDAIVKAIETESKIVRRTKYRVWEAFVDLRLRDALDLSVEYLLSQPNDVEVIRAQQNILRYLGRQQEARLVAHRLANIAGDDPAAMQNAVSNLALSDDAAGAVEIARRALERHPNNMLLIYQAHRALLWDGAFDEARAYLPAIKASLLPWHNYAFAELRQACADNDIAKALSIKTRLEHEYLKTDPTVLFIPYQILGMPEQATTVLMSYYEAGQLFELSRFLIYPYFDPQPFPKLMEVLRQQGIDRPPPVAIPFVCKAPAT
jgi:TolB-like protein